MGSPVPARDMNPVHRGFSRCQHPHQGTFGVAGHHHSFVPLLLQVIDNGHTVADKGVEFHLDIQVKGFGALARRPLVVTEGGDAFPGQAPGQKEEGVIPAGD
jgi:hypothetical protein